MFLRTQFIRGIRDQNIMERLLQDDETHFNKIANNAIALEAAKSDSRALTLKTDAKAFESINRVPHIQRRNSRQIQ